MSMIGKRGCGCRCHYSAGVKHFVACCNAPPYEAGAGAETDSRPMHSDESRIGQVDAPTGRGEKTQPGIGGDDMGLTGDPTLDTPTQEELPPPDNVRDFINSGRALMERFISEEEVQASSGNAHIDFEEGKGWTIKVDQGTVIGWLWLKLNNLQERAASQAGLLHAAGLQVQEMRMKLAQIERTESGIIVPPGAAMPTERL